MNKDDNKEIHDETSIIDNCIFCNIINGKLSATKIYEDNETLAFLDIKPKTKGHILIIPKYHFENIYGLPVEDWCHMNITAQKMAIAIKSALSTDGINIEMNNESCAGQIINHASIHIIPRYNDFEENSYTYNQSEIIELRDLIQKEL